MLAPLLIIAKRKNPLWIMCAAMWGIILLANEFTAQQPRYLLGAFPVALALVFAATADLMKKEIAIGFCGGDRLNCFFLAVWRSERGGLRERFSAGNYGP